MLITDGVAQNQRLPQALAEGYIRVDERSFEDLLVVGKDIAANLYFYGQNNEPKGTWERLFTSDALVIMAMMLHVDLPRIDLAFQHQTDHPPETHLPPVFEYYVQVDFWLQTLQNSSHPAAWELYLQMATAVESRLAPQLQSLGELAAHWELQQVTERLSEFSPSWGTVSPPESPTPDASLSSSSLASTSLPEPPARFSPEQARRRIQTAFESWKHAIAYWKVILPKLITDSMYTQDHDPGLGLFLVFLKQFQHAQERLNRFTQRHLDFYYKDILHTATRPPIPDSAYLVFTEVPGTEGPISIEKGTEFTPGKDANQQDLIYRADADLFVTDAQVHSLYTLRLGRDPLIAPEALLNYVTRIKSDSLPTGLNNPKAESTAKPIFGPKRNKDQEGNTLLIDLGWAVASSALFLQEGNRRIEMTIGLNTPQALQPSQPSQLLEDVQNATTEIEFCQQLGRLFSRNLLSVTPWLTSEDIEPLCQKAESTVTSEDAPLIVNLLKRLPLQGATRQAHKQAFYTILQGLFTIQITTPTGWKDVNDYSLQPPPHRMSDAPYGITFQIHLDPDFEPVGPYTPALHGGNWNTQLPLMRFLINPQALLFPYSLFEGLALDNIKIHTSVKGVKKLRIWNQLGLLDPSAPFMPLGPDPAIHSYWVLGCYEMAKKQISQAQLNITWAELPLALGGFEEHYQHYPETYTNTSFKVRASTLRGGDWLPDTTETQPLCSLFQTSTDDEQVSNSITIPLDIASHFKPIPLDTEEPEYTYNLKSRDGFIKLTLETPQTAFGHEIYPTLLTEILTANAKRKKPLPSPNAPYTPKVNGISLDYEATQTIRFQENRTPSRSEQADSAWQETVFHIHPFGKEKLNPHKKVHNSLLPFYAQDGNLFIGIQAENLSGRLTLFFHMNNDASDAALTTPIDIKWTYLADNQWQVLNRSQVISDTTHDFLSSGIVILDIPENISKDNSIMPDDLYWLRVSAQGPVSAFSRLYSVYPHALSVTATPETVLAPKRVNNKTEIEWQAVNTIPGVAEVRQKSTFFGGRPQETEIHWKTRIAERLNHKYRASTPWDYERLVLEHFPQIDKVKCFANKRFGQSGVHPGHVLVIVVQRVAGCTHQQFAQPQVGAIELRRIQEFLQTVTSPFLQIEVHNPVFETIQVRCEVKFTGQQVGTNLVNRLNQYLSNYLCPWTEGTYQGEFGWSLRQEDMEAAISSLDYVDFVTRFSLLHVTHQEDHFHLADTAETLTKPRPPLTPRFPWGLAVPMQHHLIETIPVVKAKPANVTGVSHLEIGQTFIIQKERSDVETQ